MNLSWLTKRNAWSWKSRLVLGLLLLVLVSRLNGQDASQAKLTWKRIEYPKLSLPELVPDGFDVSLSPGASQLKFGVGWWQPKPDDKPEHNPRGLGSSVVRLHLSDGTIVTPEKNYFTSTGGRAGSSYDSFTYYFPWQRNALEEAWVELAVGGQNFWIEIPYGFTRNPSDPLPTKAKSGSPVFPPTMKELGEKDHLVPWLHVTYDFGKIQNDWRLSLELANPFDASAEVILYQNPGGEGESVYRWKLDTPRTKVAVRLSDGTFLHSHQMAARLHTDGMRRSDDHSFSTYPVDGRGWGEVIIEVDGRPYIRTIPSSLFQNAHGITDHLNKRRLPRQK
jgi:hypothetical protein